MRAFYLAICIVFAIQANAIKVNVDKENIFDDIGNAVSGAINSITGNTEEKESEIAEVDEVKSGNKRATQSKSGSSVETPKHTGNPHKADQEKKKAERAKKTQDMLKNGEKNAQKRKEDRENARKAHMKEQMVKKSMDKVEKAMPTPVENKPTKAKKSKKAQKTKPSSLLEAREDVEPDSPEELEAFAAGEGMIDENEGMEKPEDMEDPEELLEGEGGYQPQTDSKGEPIDPMDGEKWESEDEAALSYDDVVQAGADHGTDE